MKKSTAVIFLSVTLVALLVVTNFPRIVFWTGGFFTHTGYILQNASGRFHDRVADDQHPHPYEVFRTIMDMNHAQATAWRLSPGMSERKPKALLIMCIDPRLDDNRILGDTRGYYDIIRIPGSVITPEIAEAVELAVVKHEVKLVLVATHTDCAMEKLAHSPEGHGHYPLLARGVNEHTARLRTLAERPEIRRKIRQHDLWVIEKRIDTVSGKFR